MQIAVNQECPKQALPSSTEQKIERIVAQFETKTLKTCLKDEINKSLEQVRAKYK